MVHREHSDPELVAFAANGDMGAFAVLFHRHAAHVHALEADTTDPHAHLVDVFTRAMQRLDEAPDDDVAGWLGSLTDGSLSGDRSRSASGGDADHHPPDEAITAPVGDQAALDDEQMDAAWRELARRWPDGRAAPNMPSWLVWVTTAAVTIALSAGIPWWTLGPDAPVDDLTELRAFPIVEAREQPDPADEDEVEETPLPTFEFPVPPEEAEEPPEPEQDTDDPTLDDTIDDGTDGEPDGETDGEPEGEPDEVDDGPDDADDDPADDGDGSEEGA